MGSQACSPAQMLRRAALLGHVPSARTLAAARVCRQRYATVMTSSVPFRMNTLPDITFNPRCNAMCHTTVRNFGASTQCMNETTHSTSNSNSSSNSSSNENVKNSSEEAYSSVDDIREAVLDAALQFVSELGWSDEAIAKGAESLGYSSMAHGLVEGGGAELFCRLQLNLNDQLEQRLIHLSKLKEKGSAENKSVLVEDALRYRLELVLPYVAVYAKGLAVAALSPTHVPVLLRTTAQLADHICHYTGFTDPNFGWYTSRMSVGALYKVTELHLLQDQSLEYQDTWQFLHRRVQELDRCEVTCARLESAAESSVSVACAAVLTGLNILGLNRMSR